MAFDAELCRKYSDLNEEEIDFLRAYSEKMQDLANEIGADIFIDCKTLTGKSGLVIAEAKPETVSSAYKEEILGMIIKWQDEPAVERTFHMQVPTIGLKSVKSPGDIQVIQSVFPIMYQDKMLAVLIYEQRQHMVLFGQKVLEESLLEDTVQKGFDLMQEAVLLISDEKMIVYCNPRASELFRKVGYVSSLIDMPAENLWKIEQSADREPQTQIVTIGNYVLKGICCRIDHPNARYLLTIEDITELIEWKNHCVRMQMAQRELRHRIKNSLQLISSIMNYKSGQESTPEAKMAFQEAAIRISSVLITLEESSDGEDEKIAIRNALDQLCKDLAYTFAPIQIRVEGEEISVSGSYAVVICLIVNELIYNAMKYAFHDKRNGVIKVCIRSGVLFHTISVEDNGSGIQVSNHDRKPLGLDLVRNLVEDRLDGEMRIKTGDWGTCIEFDFME